MVNVMIDTYRGKANIFKVEDLNGKVPSSLKIEYDLNGNPDFAFTKTTRETITFSGYVYSKAEVDYLIRSQSNFLDVKFYVNNTLWGIYRFTKEVSWTHEGNTARKEKYKISIELIKML